jgi:hypothetical protein
MNWQKLLEWYRSKCDAEEGYVTKRVILKPRMFGLRWPGKKIRVTIETIPDLEDECDLWTITLVKIPR